MPPDNMDDLIIIVPTYNKQEHLHRICKYYSSFPYKVYVCDSSKTKASIPLYSNIVYNWCPELNFFEKILHVLNSTTAAYYALTPDDDFMKESTLTECYLEIKENKKYNISGGFQVFFNEHFDKQFFTVLHSNLLAGLNEMQFASDDEYIDYFWSHYQNILWSVYRKEVLLSSFTCLHSANIEYGNLIEMVVGIECLKTGQIYVSKNALNFREQTLSFHWGAVAPEINSITIDKNPTLKRDTDSMLRYYSQIGDNSFARKCLSSYIKSHTITPSKSIVSKIKSFIPTPIRHYIFNLIHKRNDGLRIRTPYYDNEMLNKITSAMSC